MATLKAKTSDGKTLSINIPEGTDPSMYDGMVEDAVSHYESSKAPVQPSSESSKTPLESLRSASDFVMGMSPMGQAKMLKEKVVSPLFKKAGEVTKEKSQQFGLGPTASTIAGKAVEYAPDIAEIAAPAGAIFKPFTSLNKANTALEAAEKTSGIGLDKVTRFPSTKEAVNEFADNMGKLSRMGPESIRKIMEKEGMQQLRKQGEAVYEHITQGRGRGMVDKTAKVLIARGKAALAEALKKEAPLIKEPMETYQAVKNREDILRLLGKGGNVAWKAAAGGAGVAGIAKLLSGRDE